MTVHGGQRIGPEFGPVVDSAVQVHHDGHNAYTVRFVGVGAHSCGLTVDEALGQVASWLFRGTGMFSMYEDDDPDHKCWKPTDLYGPPNTTTLPNNGSDS